MIFSHLLLDKILTNSYIFSLNTSIIVINRNSIVMNMYMNENWFLCGILSTDLWTHCSWNDPITPVVRLPALTGWRGNFIWMYICSFVFVHCMYIPAETDHISTWLYRKYNKQFHIVKLHEPKKASWQTQLSPRKVLFRLKTAFKSLLKTFDTLQDWFPIHLYYLGDD